MKERNPIAVLLLSLFVPFYVLYWFYQTAKTLQARGTNPPRFILLVGPLIAYLLLLVPFILLSASGTRTPLLNLIITLAGVIMVVLMIVLPFIYYYRFSKASEVATNNKVSTTVLFLLFIFVGAVSCYLIQDALNQTETTASLATDTPTINPPVPTAATPIAETPVVPPTNPVPTSEPTPQAGPQDPTQPA